MRVLVMSHWHVEVRCMHGHASRKGETRQEMFHRHWHLKIELDLKIWINALIWICKSKVTNLVAAEGGSDVQLVVLLLFLATVGEFDKEWLLKANCKILNNWTCRMWILAQYERELRASKSQIITSRAFLNRALIASLMVICCSSLF